MPTVDRYLVDEVKMLEASAPAARAAELLGHDNVRDVLVVDEGGRLIGILRDAPADGTVGEAAEPAPMAVPADADAQETLDRMLTDDLRRLAVVDAVGRPIGILARSLLERRLARDRRRESA